MNADNIPASKWSVLTYVLLLLLALMIFGCDSSTENKEDPAADPFETRIVYQKSGADDVNYYSANLSGESELMCDFSKFAGMINDYRELSFNSLKGKVIFHNKKDKKIIISNYDGSDTIHVKLEGAEEPYDDVSLFVAPNGEWAYCEIHKAGNCKSYRVDMNGNGVEIIMPEPDRNLQKTMFNKLNVISFSADGKLFAYGNGYYIVVRDTTGALVKLYGNYNTRSVKITPDGEKVVFLYSGNGIEQGIHSLNILNDAAANITSDSLHAEDFSISPDGKYVAFNAYNSNHDWTVYLYDMINNTLKPLVEESSSRRNLLFISEDEIAWQSGASTVSIMKIDGSGKRVLLENALLLGSGRFKTN